MINLRLPPFLHLFVPLALVIAGFAYLGYQQERELIYHDIEHGETERLSTARLLVNDTFSGIIQDLRLLAQLPILRLYLSNNFPQHEKQTEEMFRLFVSKKHVFDQVRYIDENGMERIRVNLGADGAVVLPENKLSNKAGRYYFTEAMKLQPEQVFVSRFDLNVERGEVEQPYKPMLRFATRVQDAQGRARGILVFNYAGDNLRNIIRSATAATRGQLMVLNDEGYWLLSPHPNDEWGFMFNTPSLFSHRYPALWKRLQQQRGQFRTADELVSFITVNPEEYLGADAKFSIGNARGIRPWTILTIIDADAISKLLAPRVVRISASALVGLLLSFGLALWYHRHRRQSQKLIEHNLQQARAITEKQRLLDLFITHVPAPVAMLDRDMRYIACSTRWREDYHLQQDILHRSHFDVFPDIPQAWKDIYQRCLEDGTDYRCDEELFRRQDGGEHWLRWEVRPWYDATDKIGGIVMLMEDITAYKHAEGARDEFVAKVSHELRTPLMAVCGSLQLLQKKAAAQLHEKERSMLDISERNSQRLLHLVNDLLDMQKLKLGQIRFDMAMTNLQDVVRAAMNALEELAAQTGISIVLDDLTGNAQVYCDAARIEQVMTNLLSNALKYSPPGSQIEVTISREAGNIQVAVNDNGPGVTPRFEPQLFEAFTQADTGNTRHPGSSGLGLAISRGIIEQHGGSMGYAKRHGGGARFYFLLPEIEYNENNSYQLADSC